MPGYEREVRAVTRRCADGVAAIEQDRPGSILAAHVGTSSQPRVMLVGDMQVMSNPEYCLSKAVENQVGCALAVEALRHVSAKAHPNTVDAVGTVQEVGMRGARTSAPLVAPELALILHLDSERVAGLTA